MTFKHNTKTGFGKSLGHSSAYKKAHGFTQVLQDRTLLLRLAKSATKNSLQEKLIQYLHLGQNQFQLGKATRVKYEDIKAHFEADILACCLIYRFSSKCGAPTLFCML